MLKLPKIKTKSALFAAAITPAILAQSASATWSILIADTRTGEIVVGSATCLTGFDLAIETPVILTGIGAITAQSSVDSTGLNRMLARDGLLERQTLNSILSDLSEFDAGHNNRQYGMITASGQTLTYSGIDNADWAGGITGRIEQGRPGPADDIVFAVQGNILTGQPVVQAAVDAIIATNTDLPGKLMAAMLAARVTGGDGRCSCSSANPTSCGSPPPGDFKSAHVGYMIGSRADDTDSIRAFYQLPAQSTSLTKLGSNQFAIADTNGDIHIYNNATNTNTQTAHFTFEHTLETNLPNLSKLITADLDNNGLPDLIALSSNSTITIFLQSTPMNFDPPIQHQFPDTITDIDSISTTSSPADHLLLTTNNTAQAYLLSNDTLIPTTSATTDSANAQSHLADLNNDSIHDLIILKPKSQSATLHQSTIHGDLSDPFATLPLSNDPIQARTADINNDGLIDILVATGSSRVINTFINTGTPETPAFSKPIISPLANQAVDFQLTDLNNDSVPDAIVLLQSGANLRYYLGDGTGTFTETDRTRMGGTPTNALLADLNNDGDQDLITNAGSKLLIYDNLQNATVQRQTGFARGNKFMFINIFNQNTASQDPVDQMLTRFDEFRMDQANKIDAVQTQVTTPSRILIDDFTPTTSSIRIDLRDFQHSQVTSPTSFTLTHNPTNLTLGLPTFVAPGLYEIPVSATTEQGAQPGNHKVTIKATTTKDGSPYSVTLMPSITLSTTHSLADYNADAVHDFFDISIFLNSWSAQSPTADLNNDTLFTIEDISLFLTAYKAAP